MHVSRRTPVFQRENENSLGGATRRSRSRADGNRSASVFASSSGAGAGWVDYIPTTVPSWEAALTGFAAMLVLVAALVAAIMGVRWYRGRHRCAAA